MRDIETRRAGQASDVPEDLRVFGERLAAAGVEVRLSTAGAEYQLPEPVWLVGTPLSTIICEQRRAE